MIYLDQNSSNTISIKVDDIQTETDPIYLFRFVDDVTKIEYLIELDNEITGNDRFSLFTLVLPDDLDLPAGIYRYYVYQSDTPGDEDYEDMLQLREDACTVLMIFDEGTTYEPTGTDTVYQP